jgi:exonuclease SbcD
VGGAYTVDTAALCANAQYVALGHLHRPQQLKASSFIRYSGSPLAYSFSEAGQAKSVTILDVAPGAEPVLTEVFLSSGKPLVRWKAIEGIAQVHRWLDEGKHARAWIDLELHITDSLSMEQIQHLRKQHSGIINIRPVYPEAVIDKEAGEAGRRDQLPIDEMFRRFYTRQTGGAEADPELVSLFLELLQQSTETEIAASDAEREDSQ